MDYETQARLASIEQGTESISILLSDAGIPNTIEQTGGFVMLTAIWGKSGAWIGVNDEGICFYKDQEDEGNTVEWRKDGVTNKIWRLRAIEIVKELLPKLGEVETR